jgi:hypothetical protein
MGIVKIDRFRKKGCDREFIIAMATANLETPFAYLRVIVTPKNTPEVVLSTKKPENFR